MAHRWHGVKASTPFDHFALRMTKGSRADLDTYSTWERELIDMGVTGQQLLDKVASSVEIGVA
jgi:hypothetical protein